MFLKHMIDFEGTEDEGNLKDARVEMKKRKAKESAPDLFNKI